MTDFDFSDEGKNTIQMTTSISRFNSNGAEILKYSSQTLNKLE